MSEISGIERDYVRWYPVDIKQIDYKQIWEKESIGLYIHIPFCANKCHFCRYNSVVGTKLTKKIAKFLFFLKQEIESVSQMPQISNAALNVIYIGGGTPSILTSEQIADLLTYIKQHFELQHDCEISFEANPSTLNEKKIETLYQAGIRRLSIGVQSFDDEILNFIGRDHSSLQAQKTVISAKKVGFNNINVDLIYRLPKQNINKLMETIQIASELPISHISFYPLWLREDTVLFKKMQQNDLILPNPQQEFEMLSCSIDTLQKYDYMQYNSFDFKKPAAPKCRYTELQWEDGNWIGCGPSAISYLHGHHIINAYDLHEYYSSIQKSGISAMSGGVLSVNDRMRRTMMFGIRMLPFRCDRFEKLYGVDVDDIFHKQLSWLVQNNFIERSNGEIRLTRKGIHKINNVCKIFYSNHAAPQIIGMKSDGKKIEEIDY